MLPVRSPPTSVEQLKFVGIAGTKLWILQVDSPHPIALAPEEKKRDKETR